LPFTDPVNKAAAAVRVPVLICPSEQNDRSTTVDNIEQRPICYAANQGTWLVFNPAVNIVGDGVFEPNAKIGMKQIVDGTSKTLAFAEVKTYQPMLNPGSAGTAKIPDTPAQVAALGGEFQPEDGHAGWVEGRAGQDGFTTTFPPNTLVSYTSGGTTYDIDYTSAEEGENATDITYAAVTSRSYHAGTVNAAMVDGSARNFASDTDQLVWRALGTRNGGEAVTIP
jgi:prepilin-type processing-associated H-X9-DG protein